MIDISIKGSYINVLICIFSGVIKLILSKRRVILYSSLGNCSLYSAINLQVWFDEKLFKFYSKIILWQRYASWLRAYRPCIHSQELQERVAPKAHTHPIAQVQGLQSALDEKLNRSGGSIQGDFSVEGNAYMRNLHLEEFLDVPEFRYNRVETTVGDKWSAPGAGVVLAVDKDNCRLSLKLEPGEVASLRRDDLCMGIFKSSTVGNFTEPTEDSDDSKGIRTFAGFTTCYFRLVECLDEQTFGEWRYELREGFAYHPTEMM